MVVGEEVVVQLEVVLQVLQVQVEAAEEAQVLAATLQMVNRLVLQVDNLIQEK
jgi:hypothetical protein